MAKKKRRLSRRRKRTRKELKSIRVEIEPFSIKEHEDTCSSFFDGVGIPEGLRSIRYSLIERLPGEALVDYYKRKCRIKSNGEIAFAGSPEMMDNLNVDVMKEAMYLFAKDNGIDFDPRAF